MTNTPPPMPAGAEDPDNKLTSPQFDEFKEALETLYILANQSGRIQFAKAWPAAADPIFGEELTKHDVEGTPDKERRAELEAEAEDRRLELLEFMDNIEDNSIKDGAVQIEYVKQHVERMGRELSLLIYGLKLVDRFIPPPPPQESEDDEGEKAATPAPEKVTETESEILVSPEMEAELKQYAEQRNHVQSAAEHDIEKELKAKEKEAEQSSVPQQAPPQDTAGRPREDAPQEAPDAPAFDPMDQVKPIDTQNTSSNTSSTSQQPEAPQDVGQQDSPPSSAEGNDAPPVQSPPVDAPRVQPPPVDEPRVQPPPSAAEPEQTSSPIAPVSPVAPVTQSPAAPESPDQASPSSQQPVEKPDGQKAVSMKFVSSKDKPKPEGDGAD